MSDIPPYYAQQPVQKGSSFWKWLAITIIFCFGLTVVGGMAVCAMFYKAANAFFSSENYQTGYTELDDGLTEVVTKWGADSEKVLIIPFHGVIMNDYTYTGDDLVSNIKAQLKMASKDDDVRAVILDIDSPGGEAYTCDLIAEAIRNFQDTSKKPVIACIGDMGASGGYYISAPASWIVAHETSITGSIGVISSSFNYRGLLDKIGVTPVVYKSGKFKDMLRGSKSQEEITPEEQAMMQNLIDTMYARFKNVVHTGRTAPGRSELPTTPKALAEDWEAYADGRIILGKDALTIGLVDELGGMDQAIETAKKIADLHKEPTFIRYESSFDWNNFFRIFLENKCVNPNTVKIALGDNLSADAITLEPGKPYYLP